MRRLMAALLLGALASAPISAALSTSEIKRLEDAAAVLRELHAAPDQDVPLDLWEKASCVMVPASSSRCSFDSSSTMSSIATPMSPDWPHGTARG
ncbi:MAG: hypothetical protein ACO3C1_11060 [Ilumatobacteraceae bacterium]